MATVAPSATGQPSRRFGATHALVIIAIAKIGRLRLTRREPPAVCSKSEGGSSDLLFLYLARLASQRSSRCQRTESCTGWAAGQYLSQPRHRSHPGQDERGPAPRTARGQIPALTETRIYGCLLTPAAAVQGNAAEAADDKIVIVNHKAAVHLCNRLAKLLAPSGGTAITIDHVVPDGPPPR